MSGKAVISALSIGGYSILAIPTQSIGGYSILAIPTQSIGGYSILTIPTQSVGGYSILAIPTQSAAYMWLRGDGCGWRGGGCVGMAGMPYPPINTSASTDADVCADRCGCLRRPMRMSAPTDADVCVDRCEPCRKDFLALTSGKAERSPSLTTLLVLPYRNDQQCIIPKKAVRHSMSHRFLYIYKYRLYGNVGVILQGQGEPYMLTLYSFYLHRS